MTRMTRRDVFAAGALAAGAATGAVAVSATAAAAAEGKPAGMLSYRIGDFTCTALNDGAFTRPLDDKFVTNAPFEAVQAALADQLMPTDQITIPFTTFAVDTGTRLVLIDAGTGGQLAPTAGTMLANMAAAGLDPMEVDLVLVSHFHPDHIFGLMTKEGDYVFPNAEIAVPMAEWLYWMDDGEMSRAPEARQGLFKRIREIFGPKASEVRLVGDGEEIVTGIKAMSAHGHTPGHTVFHLASGDDEMMVLGDTTNHPALFVANPDWSVMFDMDPAMAAVSRRRLLDQVTIDRIKVAGYHFPFPNVGRIARDGDGFIFAAASAAWQPHL